MSQTQISNDEKVDGSSHVKGLARVFTIPAGVPFLDSFVSALTTGELIDGFRPADDPLQLPDATIYVPSRRAARALNAAFLNAGGRGARLLPTIRTLGDVSDDEFGISPNLGLALEFPEAVGTLQRKLELSKLVQTWVDALSTETRRLYGDEEIFIPSSQADSIRLSEDLCGLLDEITQEESGWEMIRKTVPEEHQDWWDLTSSFLSIIMKHWPNLLKSQDLMDPAQRAIALLDQRIQHYESGGSEGPVIIAGSTGSVPSTRRFLEVVSRMPNGAVVLPAVDMELDEVRWNALDPKSDPNSATQETHPQFGLAKLLRALGLNRKNVTELGKPVSKLSHRSRLVNTALALPEFSDCWKTDIAEFDIKTQSEAFEDVALVEANNERQEALAVALALRETLETPGKSAALVTSDRNLANRVSVELQRFGLEVDDTSGAPLRNSQIGLFVRQLIGFVFGDCSKADIAALMKSTWMPCSLSLEDSLWAGRAFEQFFLRGKIGKPEAGLLVEWLSQFAVAEAEGANAISTDLMEKIHSKCNAIDEGIRELRALACAEEQQPIGPIIEALSNALLHLCRDDQEAILCSRATGFIELQELFSELIRPGASDYMVGAYDFPAVFDAVIAPVTVRLRTPTHPRLHIYGPLEVRLLDHDRIILAGLNEGSWPAATRNDAFLNRLMRRDLGMASPERGIGLAAHDFQTLMGKREVILSRSNRVDKAPAIASRWVQRLLAVLGKSASNQMRERGARYLDYANALDASDKPPKRGTRPSPSPPLSARPTSLPVTDIETWIRDPYALYAKRILKLRPLPPLEREPDSLLKGTIYHAIMEDYVQLENHRLPAAKREELLVDLAKEYLGAEKLAGDVETLWLMRFTELASRIVEWETKHHSTYPVREIRKEIEGGIKMPNTGFFLHARADRIDVLEDGSLQIIDYKTGSSPSLSQARSLSPQLALEGAIAEAGGFVELKSRTLDSLAFLRLRDGSNFKFEAISDSKNPLQDIVNKAAANLEQLVAAFMDENTGYVSRRAPFKQEVMDSDYDHLARTREWSFGEEADDE